VIVGYTYFGKDMDGNVYDTAIPTSEIDEVTLSDGMYDELFTSVNTEIDKTNERPDGWEIKTIMDAKFNDSLEAGSIDGSGHKVTKIQMYRREYQTQNSEWLLISQFDYEETYNMYTVIDRFVENGKTYEYGVLPLADDVQGNLAISQPITVKFDGTFVSDADTNYPMDLDFKFGDLTYNRNTSTMVPLNGKFPVVSFGDQNYRTGNVEFLPITNEQRDGVATEIDPHAELMNRQEIINFLNNGKAKVIRRDDGDVLVVTTTNIKVTPKSETLDSISNVSFDITEIGEMDFETMDKAGLIGGAGKSIYTFDDFGDTYWDNEPVDPDSRRESETSFGQKSK
jgi:hypothetical protein